jgi:glutamate synthase domain-containing protein 2/glutamate synthase domain-containing protein 1/glutamate synthase domain-containing protein 3
MTDGWPLVRSGELLYQNDIGSDACGIGGIASKDGAPSREVVKKSLAAVAAMEHRGGVCGETGDGTGLTCVLPHAYFQDVAKGNRFPGARYLKPEDRLAVGVLFVFEADAGRQESARAIVRKHLQNGPVTLLGFRPVPTNEDVSTAAARATRPQLLEHVILKVEGDSAESFLFRARLAIRHAWADAGLNAYCCSLSSRLISYKALLTAPQFVDYYPDLHENGFTTGIAFFHRRYSTNTLPNWKLAQPFRYSCHNGEINTIRTNRNAVSAFSRGLTPPLPGVELHSPKMSDSAGLDEWIEYLMLDRGWSLARALRLAIPPVWDTEAEVWGSDAFDLFTYCRRTYGSLCAWDGPAGIVATDGRTLIALVDRMGLRPVRWCTDERGWLYVASESGVFGVDNAAVTASGQLQPGQMIALDTATGTFMESRAIMDAVVKEAQAELGDIHELNRRQIVVPEGFDFARQVDDTVGAMLAERNWSLEQLLQAAGWDFDRAVFVKDMAKLRKEPLSSMGHDRQLTVFSSHHPTLFKYLQQTFAEVTNPPIDPYREGGAMSLATYLGRSALTAGKPLPLQGEDEMPVKQVELSSPVVSDAVIEEMRTNEQLGFKLLDATFVLDGGTEALKTSLHALQAAAERAVHEGYHILCVSDKDACKIGVDPMPSLLALGAVHTYLCKQGLRDRCSLVVQAGDIQEGHDVACLVAFGADAVHPYLMLRLVHDGITYKHPESKQEITLPARDALENLFEALEDTFKKIISKMGITTIEGYRGARLFEAVGFGPELMEFLGDFPSRVGGIGLDDLVDDCKWRVQQAEKMTVLGRNRDYMAFNAKVRMALRDAVKEAHPEPEPGGGEMAYTAPPDEPEPDGLIRVGVKYEKFSKMVSERPPTVLRDLFNVTTAGVAPVPLESVIPASEIVRRYFRGAAMSHGALTGASHMTIAAALNELGGMSNSGEGGESRWRNDIPEKAWSPFWQDVRQKRIAHSGVYTLDGHIDKGRFKSRIRQVASGRFGVDAEYLVNADELQIKMAQGAKPGEGGQLMGKKVTAEIAEIRFAKPGTDLISPPPHHDIYSIEDLAQLIADLKAIKPGVRVSVKLVAVDNIGTIAVGVAKAGADVIEIDGIDGGTGAAMVSSKEHAGLPSEMGLAESHQALVVNGLRSSVKLRVGGGIKTGADVIKYALFGADEFSFGQGLMVSVGCIVCKSCHIPNCPTGITGSPEIFKGHPEHTKAYLLTVAEEVRKQLAALGATDIPEITGCSDRLEKRTNLPARAAKVDVARFIRPDMALNGLAKRYPQVFGLGGACANPGPTLNDRIVLAAHDAIEAGQEASLLFKIKNGDRSVGATAAGMIARLYGRDGMPGKQVVKLRFDGEAGQSFGAWCVTGLDLDLRGVAQDGVAKGISGGVVTVTLDYSASPPDGELLSVAGNNVGFGATGGMVYIGGRAGHRLGIRNSGATIVAEAAGKYACEYMTRGRVLVLGPVENEIGSGMTGGELVIYDPHREVPAKLHSTSVAWVECTHVDYEWVHPLAIEYHKRTGSRQAQKILANWADIRRGRKLIKVLPFAVARARGDYKTVGTNAG